MAHAKLFDAIPLGERGEQTSADVTSLHATALKLKMDSYKRECPYLYDEERRDQRIEDIEVRKRKVAAEARKEAVKAAGYPVDPVLTQAIKRWGLTTHPDYPRTLLKGLAGPTVYHREPPGPHREMPTLQTVSEKLMGAFLRDCRIPKTLVGEQYLLYQNSGYTMNIPDTTIQALAEQVLAKAQTENEDIYMDEIKLTWATDLVRLCFGKPCASLPHPLLAHADNGAVDAQDEAQAEADSGDDDSLLHAPHVNLGDDAGGSEHAAFSMLDGQSNLGVEQAGVAHGQLNVQVTAVMEYGGVATPMETNSMPRQPDFIQPPLPYQIQYEILGTPEERFDRPDGCLNSTWGWDAETPTGGTTLSDIVPASPLLQAGGGVCQPQLPVSHDPGLASAAGDGAADLGPSKLQTVTGGKASRRVVRGRTPLETPAVGPMPHVGCAFGGPTKDMTTLKRGRSTASIANGSSKRVLLAQMLGGMGSGTSRFGANSTIPSLRGQLSSASPSSDEEPDARNKLLACYDAHDGCSNVNELWGLKNLAPFAKALVKKLLGAARLATSQAKFEVQVLSGDKDLKDEIDLAFHRLRPGFGAKEKGAIKLLQLVHLGNDTLKNILLEDGLKALRDLLESPLKAERILALYFNRFLGWDIIADGPSTAFAGQAAKKSVGIMEPMLKSARDGDAEEFQAAITGSANIFVDTRARRVALRDPVFMKKLEDCIVEKADFIEKNGLPSPSTDDYELVLFCTGLLSRLALDAVQLRKVVAVERIITAIRKVQEHCTCNYLSRFINDFFTRVGQAAH